MPAKAMLRLVNVSKSFGEVKSLQNTSTSEVWPGEVVGLLGDNSAGKSTLDEIITGYHQPDSKRRVTSTARRVENLSVPAASSWALKPCTKERR